MSNSTSLDAEERPSNANQLSSRTPLTGMTSLIGHEMNSNQISDLAPLSGLTSLTYQLIVSNNQISDLAPLSGLTNLEDLRLENNHISDLYPLVENEGLAAGDKVDVAYNPLSDISISEYIPALQARGVQVLY